mgnify:CR=1 FL=1
MKLTPWINGNIKPIRKGVYMLMCGGHGMNVGYQYWNGSIWGAWNKSAKAAYQKRSLHATQSHQYDDWRGLAEKPK